MTHSNRTRRPAPRLIEIFGSAAVLALLVAVLAPILGMAKLRGKTTTDMSNLRQLSLATEVYALDSNDRLPLAFDPHNRSDLCSEDATWRQRLLPYLTTRRLFVSPTAPNTPGTLCPAGSAIRYVGNYGAQVFWASRGEDSLSLSSFQIPSDTFLFGINADSSPVVAPENGRCSAYPFAPTGTLAKAEKVTWSFADGHVKQLTQSETYAKDCSRWQTFKPRAYFEP
ncbi:MAG TPA: hypothetical protein PLL78_14480 [Fimbriimonadaceae bacterium]|nr:hypothetical protein [Fimbriimonadaceae bacterium]HRJ97881.1 hypothetical protein [Fimbriimonadaceae bacterium]